jgi:hypothetical protein
MRGINMNVSRRISIDYEYIKKMKPYLEKHNGNFGDAIREMIASAERYSPRTNLSAIDKSLFNWMLERVEDMLIPDEILDELIDPALINWMSELEDHLKRRFGGLDWGVNLSLKYDSNVVPREVLIEIRGSHPKIRFIACMLSQYLIKNSLNRLPLEIKSIADSNVCIKIELSRSNRTDAQKSLIAFFGGKDEIIKNINNRPDFWKSLINRHIVNNYNMVTVHRNYFEDLLAGKVPAGEITIENLAKKPIQDIPLNEMLSMIKEVYETSRVVERVEIDKDTVILFHNYRAKEAIEKIKKTLVILLEANGHLYDAKSTSNMIVLTHGPDVGMRINTIVDNLKISSSSVDQELSCS